MTLFASYRDFSGPWRWAHFTPRELACKCGGRFCDHSYWHDPGFLDALQDLRRRLRAPLIVTSGHRDPIWNARVGGAPRSMHKSIAVDIALAGLDRFAVLAQARAAGFTGFGLASGFIHLDRRAWPAEWDYGPASRALWKLETKEVA